MSASEWCAFFSRPRVPDRGGGGVLQTRGYGAGGPADVMQPPVWTGLLCLTNAAWLGGLRGHLLLFWALTCVAGPEPSSLPPR
ncbi:hypothetical protein NDU88_000845 [Pleurodeles waltl]|uniref:Uncharacterized protein n=1 Tax=Pleurodeles waltl TaxID=8319 RepID=A0AAV7U6E7_PLEWA|nr:hypothetical protein NDU88_000845 [Pleurodeles waltl]